jgi:hypothetical protein
MDDPRHDLDPYLEGACAHRACGSPTRLKLTCTQFGLRALRTGGAGTWEQAPAIFPHAAVRDGDQIVARQMPLAIS